MTVENDAGASDSGSESDPSEDDLGPEEFERIVSSGAATSGNPPHYCYAQPMIKPPTIFIRRGNTQDPTEIVPSSSLLASGAVPKPTRASHPISPAGKREVVLKQPKRSPWREFLRGKQPRSLVATADAATQTSFIDDPAALSPRHTGLTTGIQQKPEAAGKNQQQHQRSVSSGVTCKFDAAGPHQPGIIRAESKPRVCAKKNLTYELKELKDSARFSSETIVKLFGSTKSSHAGLRWETEARKVLDTRPACYSRE